MKKLVTALAVSVMAASVPAFGAVHSTGHDENCVRDCQMLVKNCGQETDSIHQRISRLSAEIAKGTAVYTSAELMTLTRKLQDARDTLANLTTGG